MSVWQAALLGVVEGITEFLPVSSTGHLIIASSLLGLPQTAFTKSFEIAIQSGAILAVVALFGRAFGDKAVLGRLAAAFIPTGIIGFILYGAIKQHALGSVSVVAWALGIGGAALIAFEWLYRPKKHEDRMVSYAAAIAMGAAQALAMIPGVSRSAATVVGGMALGVPRAQALEFSFLLAVPTMLVAAAYDLMKSGDVFTGADWRALGVGFIASFAVAMLGIQWLMAFMRRHTFVPFGVYRIIAAFALYFFVA
jgi:undecaprenyl-diphosphatase